MPSQEISELPARAWSPLCVHVAAGPFADPGIMTPAVVQTQDVDSQADANMCAHPGAMLLASCAKLSTFAGCPTLAALFMVPCIVLATTTYVGMAAAPADITPRAVPLCFCGLSSKRLARGGQVYASSIPAMQAMEGRHAMAVDHIRICYSPAITKAHHGLLLRCILTSHLSQRVSRKWFPQLQCSLPQVSGTTP